VDVLSAELVQLCYEYPLALAVPDSLAEGPLLVLIELGAVPAGKDETLDVRFKGPIELSLAWNHLTLVGLSCGQILLSWSAITSNYPVVIPEAYHLLCIEFRQVHQMSLKLVLKLQLADVVLQLLDGARNFMRMI
jgi:hypothetical protein